MCVYFVERTALELFFLFIISLAGGDGHQKYLFTSSVLSRPPWDGQHLLVRIHFGVIKTEASLEFIFSFHLNQTSVHTVNLNCFTYVSLSGRRPRRCVCSRTHFEYSFSFPLNYLSLALSELSSRWCWLFGKGGNNGKSTGRRLCRSCDGNIEALVLTLHTPLKYGKEYKQAD